MGRVMTTNRIVTRDGARCAPAAGVVRLPKVSLGSGQLFISPSASEQRARRANNPGWSTAKNRKWQEKNPEKRAAHKQVEWALGSRRLVRQPCERCGSSEGVHAHHDDYSRPLEVMWLCRAHHKERHRELEMMEATREAA
jgi:hypothetical protein